MRGKERERQKGRERERERGRARACTRARAREREKEPSARESHGWKKLSKVISLLNLQYEISIELTCEKWITNEVATVSRLLQIIGLFCRIQSLL